MSDTPPFGDDTDEAVSAAIDGELADFAAERDQSLTEVERRLSAWSGFDERRRELDRARAAVAVGAPSLDRATRRHLVLEAKDRLPALRERRTQRVWRPLLAVAAIVAVLFGAGFALSRLGGGSAGKASKSAAGSAAQPLIENGAFVGAVGDVSDPAALRIVLSNRLAGLPAHTNDESPAGAAAANQQARSTSPAPTAPATPDTAGRDAALRCAALVDPGRAGSSDRVVLLATATFQGRDVVVMGVRRGVRSIVFVADRATCAVLTSQST